MGRAYIGGQKQGRVRLDFFVVLTESLNDVIDIVRVTGHETPAVLIGAMGPCKFFHCGRGVTNRIDTDRHEVDILAQLDTQHVAHHCQVLRHEWARALTVRENKVDDDDFVLKDIVVKLQRPTVLVYDLKIAEVIPGFL